jgi:hypothetical protein
VKSLKVFTRIWIAVFSVVGFAGGWALLAHAPKPAPLTPSQSSTTVASTPEPLPTLAPIPSLDTPSSGLQSPPVIPQVQMSFPRLRTRGS